MFERPESLNNICTGIFEYVGYILLCLPLESNGQWSIVGQAHIVHLIRPVSNDDQIVLPRFQERIQMDTFLVAETPCDIPHSFRLLHAHQQPHPRVLIPSTLIVLGIFLNQTDVAVHLLCNFEGTNGKSFFRLMDGAGD